MKNNYFTTIFLGVSTVLLCSFCCSKTEETQKEIESFTHVKVGFPSDTMNLDKYTDTMSIVPDFDNELSKALYMVNNANPIDEPFEKKDVYYTKQITDRIKIMNFGSNGRGEFAAYLHEDLGLVFLTRRDWEIDEYRLISKPSYEYSQIKQVVSYCISYSKDSIIPFPTERSSVASQ
jgi:hypothetical protein